MDLLDRYLQAIEFWLPKRQRQDIIAELSEDLRSQIEEKETELGRKLEDAEVEAILKRCGSPLTVASRYRPQQYLIGPTLFPLYRFVLTVLLIGCVVPRFLIWLGFLLVDPAHRGYLHMENMWVTILYFAFFTTLAFAIVERSGVKLDDLGHWSPRKLPPLRNPNRIPRCNSLFEIGAIAVFNVWFVSMFWPRPVIDLYGAQITLAPVWQIFFWSFLLLATFNLALSGTNLFRPHWTRLRASLRLVADGIGAGVFCWLLRTQVLVRITVPDLEPAKATVLTNLINTWMANAFWYAIAISVMILAFDVYRVVRLNTASRSTVSRLAHA